MESMDPDNPVSYSTYPGRPIAWHHIHTIYLWAYFNRFRDLILFQDKALAISSIHYCHGGDYLVLFPVSTSRTNY